MWHWCIEEFYFTKQCSKNWGSKEEIFSEAVSHKDRKKEGVSQSFLDWKFERCNYVELIDLLMEHRTMMSEHTFMASWNYCQYKQARKNILVGDVKFVRCHICPWLCAKLLVQASKWSAGASLEAQTSNFDAHCSALQMQ